MPAGSSLSDENNSPSIEEIDCSSNNSILRLTRSIFENNINIKKVYLPKSLVLIEQQAFYNANNLESIALPIGTWYYTTNYDDALNGIANGTISSNCTLFKNVSSYILDTALVSKLKKDHSNYFFKKKS